MKRLIVLLAIVAFVGSAFTAIASDKGPASISMDKAKTGVVTFDHAKHQAAADCVACHHTGGYETCDSCHGDADDGARSSTKLQSTTTARAVTKR